MLIIEKTLLIKFFFFLQRCLREEEQLTNSTKNIRKSQTTHEPVKRSKLEYVDDTVKSINNNNKLGYISRNLDATSAPRIVSSITSNKNISCKDHSRTRVSKDKRTMGPLMIKSKKQFIFKSNNLANPICSR